MQRLDVALRYLQAVLDVAAKALPSDDGGDQVRRGIEDGATTDIASALGVGLAVVMADPSADADQVDAAMAGGLTLAVTRMLEDAALAGVAQAQLEMGSLDVDWSLVNRDALAWARGYAGELVGGLNATTRDALRAAIAEWIESGEPLDALARRLAPTFGELRGRIIAETEVTRAFAQGQVQAFRRAGMTRWRFNTANDEKVCPRCGPLNGEEFGMGDATDMPPLHPRCRCWITAVDGSG